MALPERAGHLLCEPVISPPSFVYIVCVSCLLTRCHFLLRESYFYIIRMHLANLNCFVGEEHSLKMVHFMLKYLRHKSGSAALKRFSILVEGANGGFQRAFYFSIQPAHREAPFLKQTFLF